MASDLITAGQLAKLAATTKRTVLFYDEKGVLRPKRVNRSGYRFYQEKQIIDYQMILLLRTLGVSLKEMKQYLRKNGNLVKLFSEKRGEIEQKFRLWDFNLTNINQLLQNLKENGTMVNPKIKRLRPFGVYYLEKTGSYAKIGQYCDELLSMLSQRGKNAATLAIFEEQGYRPKKCQMKIGVLAGRGTKVKKEFKNVVKYLKLNPGKVITYVHHGSGSLLSLFWKELEKYCELKNIKVRKDIPDFEIYRGVNPNLTKQFFEIYLPIE